MELIIKEEFKNLIPFLSDSEFKQLEENILKEGWRKSSAIIIWENIIIDGHHRYKICQKHPHIKYKTESKDFADENEAKLWMINEQRGRRNLSDGWKYELMLVERKIWNEKGKNQSGIRTDLLSETDKRLIPINTREEIATKLGWSPTKVARADVVWKKNDKKQLEQIKNEEKSINEVYEEIKSEEKYNIRLEKITKQREEIKNNLHNLPKGTYEVIVIDPPWKYHEDEVYDSEGFRGVVDYPTMDIEEIKKIKIPASDDCVLWLWTTHKFMRHAFELLDEWGFEEKAILTWCKNKMGIGRWLRSKSEFCIMAVKGKPTINLTNQTTVLNAGNEGHSIKPQEFYDMVNELCIGRKLDYFARKKREGWDVYGDEIK